MTREPPLVSVLVRSMDRPTLQRTLDSVARQDYPAIEVIVVAACGPQHRDLPERCGAYPLRLLRPTQPLPRADAANAALDAAQGEWLNLLDDDDEFLPGHVGTLHEALSASPSTRLAHSRSEDCGADGRFLHHFGMRFKPWRQLDTGFFHPPCAMFARSLLADGARFDPRFDILEDMDFYIQCAQRTPFLFVDRVTTRYFVDSGDSGAGAGANRDEARLREAIARLRAKWIELEQRLRASAEFRLENALWLLQNGRAAEAVVMAERVLQERPGWADAHDVLAAARARR